jgi:hypothetical protein
MRDTAIGKHFAQNKHEGEAASRAGNSPNVIHRHYEAVVKEADAKEFWDITPDNVDKIVPITQGGSCLATVGFGTESLWD